MTRKIGVIGGSGLYEIAELKDKKWLPKKEGPFGMPSDDILYGQIDEVEVYFLPRHGRKHTFSPTNLQIYHLPWDLYDSIINHQHESALCVVLLLSFCLQYKDHMD